MGILSANLKKMEVLQIFSLLNQVFSFGIVVWDSKLPRNSNWGELGPFYTTKNKDRSKNVNCALFPLGPSIKFICFAGQKMHEVHMMTSCKEAMKYQ